MGAGQGWRCWGRAAVRQRCGGFWGRGLGRGPARCSHAGGGEGENPSIGGTSTLSTPSSFTALGPPARPHPRGPNPHRCTLGAQPRSPPRAPRVPAAAPALQPPLGSQALAVPHLGPPISPTRPCTPGAAAGASPGASAPRPRPAAPRVPTVLTCHSAARRPLAAPSRPRPLPVRPPRTPRRRSRAQAGGGRPLLPPGGPLRAPAAPPSGRAHLRPASRPLHQVSTCGGCVDGAVPRN